MIYAPDITPDVKTGIGSHTDQELARTMRFGVKRNGQVLVDFMPFYDMSDREAWACQGLAVRSSQQATTAR